MQCVRRYQQIGKRILLPIFQKCWIAELLRDNGKNNNFGIYNDSYSTHLTSKLSSNIEQEFFLGSEWNGVNSSVSGNK